MKVKEIMTSEVFSVAPHISIADASRLMKDKDVGSLPIIENGKLSGIITDRDFVIKSIAQVENPKLTKFRHSLFGRYFSEGGSRARRRGSQ